jgi:hypothetical protein
MSTAQINPAPNAPTTKYVVIKISAIVILINSFMFEVHCLKEGEVGIHFPIYVNIIHAISRKRHNNVARSLNNFEKG